MNTCGPGDADGLLFKDAPASGAVEFHRSQKPALAERTVNGDENGPAGIGIVDADVGDEFGRAGGTEVHTLVADVVVAIERGNRARVLGNAATLHVEAFRLNRIEGRARGASGGSSDWSWSWSG